MISTRLIEREDMGRLVDIDDVILAIDKHTFNQNSLDEDITIILEEVPTAFENNGWIPCSERLPEKSGEYLTYVDYADETFIAIDKIVCDWIAKRWNCTSNYHVIAWQPLPKPYKE